MPLRNDVLGDRRFWASLYASAFGQIGKPPEPATIFSLLDVDEHDVLAWDRQFTGWHPNIFEEADGWSDDPGVVSFTFSNGVQIRAEFHPGDQNWFLRGKDSAETTLLANIGPHWALPGLRWQEAVSIRDASPRDGWATLLLMLPIVWLTAGDDSQAARQAAQSAWAESNLVPASSAAALADLWVSAVDGKKFQWRQSSDGWVCNAEWSTRSQGKRDSALLNRLLASAVGVA